MKAMLMFQDGTSIMAVVNPTGANGELFWQRRTTEAADPTTAARMSRVFPGAEAITRVRVERVRLVNRGRINADDDGDVYMFEETYD